MKSHQLSLKIVAATLATLPLAFSQQVPTLPVPQILRDTRGFEQSARASPRLGWMAGVAAPVGLGGYANQLSPGILTGLVLRAHQGIGRTENGHVQILPVDVFAGVRIFRREQTGAQGVSPAVMGSGAMLRLLTNPIQIDGRGEVQIRGRLDLATGDVNLIDHEGFNGLAFSPASVGGDLQLGRYAMFSAALLAGAWARRTVDARTITDESVAGVEARIRMLFPASETTGVEVVADGRYLGGMGRTRVAVVFSSIGPRQCGSRPGLSYGLVLSHLFLSPVVAGQEQYREFQGSLEITDSVASAPCAEADAQQ